jgi:hypothetical protein
VSKEVHVERRRWLRGTLAGVVGCVAIAVFGFLALSGGLDELVAWWEFNEGTGSTLHDSTGSANDGTIYGATWADGMAGNGKALSFDGSNDYVRVPDRDSLDVTTLTISAWISPRSYPAHLTHAGIVGKGGYDMRTGYETLLSEALDHDTGLEAKAFEFDTNWDAMSWRPIPIDTWTFVAATHDGTVGSIFVNGELRSQSALAPVTTNSSDLYIGVRTPGNAFVAYFDGLIDEVCIFSRPLTPSEIEALYSAGPDGLLSAPPSPPEEPALEVSISGDAETVSVVVRNVGTGTSKGGTLWIEEGFTWSASWPPEHPFLHQAQVRFSRLKPGDAWETSITLPPASPEELDRIRQILSARHGIPDPEPEQDYIGVAVKALGTGTGRRPGDSYLVPTLPAHIWGTVVDRSGQPAPGVPVEVYELFGNVLIWSGESNAIAEYDTNGTELSHSREYYVLVPTEDSEFRLLDASGDEVPPNCDSDKPETTPAGSVRFPAIGGVTPREIPINVGAEDKKHASLLLYLRSARDKLDSIQSDILCSGGGASSQVELPELDVYVYMGSQGGTCYPALACEDSIYFSTIGMTRADAWHEFGHLVHFQRTQSAEAAFAEGWAILWGRELSGVEDVDDFNWSVSRVNPSTIHDWGTVYWSIMHDIIDGGLSDSDDNFDGVALEGLKAIWEIVLCEPPAGSMSNLYYSLVDLFRGEVDSIRGIWYSHGLPIPPVSG